MILEIRLSRVGLETIRGQKAGVMTISKSFGENICCDEKQRNRQGLEEWGQRIDLSLFLKNFMYFKIYLIEG